MAGVIATAPSGCFLFPVPMMELAARRVPDETAQCLENG